MTPQEIIREIHKLPPIQRKEILDYVSVETIEERLIGEEEVAKRLLAKGIIKEIPENWNEADEEFEPIEINEKPLSETIIEDREQQKMTEEEFERILFAEGIIGKPPNLDEYTDEDEDFEPIEVEGEPLSEMIIRERR